MSFVGISALATSCVYFLSYSVSLKCVIYISSSCIVLGFLHHQNGLYASAAHVYDKCIWYIFWLFASSKCIIYICSLCIFLVICVIKMGYPCDVRNVDVRSV